MSAAELEEIGKRHGSDKWSGHFYAEPYSSHLGSLRHEAVNLLEIGVGGYNDPHTGGHSLRAWKEYLPNAQIIGLDYYDKTPLQEERIHIYQGSQADPVALAKIISDYPAGFDIVIDDGSHRNEHVISSMYMLWQYVNDGGWYIIEDLQTSYWPNHGGKLHDVNSPLTSMGFLKSLIDGLNWQEIHQPTYAPSALEQQITSIHFYHNLAFLKKGSNLEGSTEVSSNRIGGV